MSTTPSSGLFARLRTRTAGVAAATGAAGPRTLPADTSDALQSALAAEHAAVWTYALATAFAAGSAASEVAAGTTAHEARRDATERLLADAGVTPRAAEPAYLPPQPVTGQTSAAAVLATAEADAEVAWRAVLERTDDADLRRTGLAALTDSALRQTRWRRLSGASPASVAMPGQPGSGG